MEDRDLVQDNNQTSVLEDEIMDERERALREKDAELGHLSKWYILKTRPGADVQVQQSLEEKGRNLVGMVGDGYLFEARVLFKDEIDPKTKKKKEVKMFPGYVYVRMIYSNDLWHEIINTDGATSFLGPKAVPLPMDEDEINALNLSASKEKKEKVFVIGDVVTAQVGDSGATAQCEIVEIDDKLNRVLVKLTLFAREITTWIDYDKII